MFVLCRSEDGKFVTPSGSKNSYTKDILKAKKFCTKEAAKSDACGNEYVIDLSKRY